MRPSPIAMDGMMAPVISPSNSASLSAGSPRRAYEDADALEEEGEDGGGIAVVLPMFSSARSMIVWGEQHPHRNNHSLTKIPWSSKELDYIGKAAKEIIARRGETPRNLCALIKDKIIHDTTCHSIFHSHHTLDSARLRWGYQAFQKRQKEKAEKDGINEEDVI